MENKKISGLDFTWDEVNSSIKNNRLLSIDLEFSRKCNLKCMYCYAFGRPFINELSYEEIIDIIKQAIDLGIKNIVNIGGGEPLLYKYYWDILEFEKKNNLKTITFTNGTIINEAIASKLYNFKENIALKFNSFNEDVQDFLVQKKGTGKKIKKALDLLLEIGYGKNNGVSLALETVITKYNYNEIETIYKFCRENNIIPYIEILTEQGLAKNNKDIGISKIHAYNLFKKLQNYDRLVWNIDWNITPPIVGQTCKRMLYSAYIRSDGNVQPCPGVEIVTENSNIRINSLADIISKNEIFIQAREIYKKIRGKCKDCDYSDCYGCRGTALFQNGGFLEEDPTCWYNN